MSPETNPERGESQEGTRGGTGFLFAFALLKLAIHLVTAGGYGWFRDELYYIACSRHLAWGYVDHPPLSIFLLRLSRAVLGDSILAIRLPPAVGGAATVFVAGWICRRLGGGRFAQALAMISVIAAPAILAIDHFYSMNAFDLLIWPAAAAILVRVLQGGDRRLWLLLGLVMGLGLLNKISVLWLGFGLAVGLLATPERRWLRTPWPWAAGAVSALCFLPYVVWQVANGWPTLEFMHNASGLKMLPHSPLGFLAEQVLMMNPVTLPIWGAGLVCLVAAKEGRPFRILGVIFLAVLALLMLNGSSRAYYLAPAYPMLFAAGGVAIERWLSRWQARGAEWGTRLLKPALVSILLSGGAALAPFGLPVLPVESYIRYAAFLGIAPAHEENSRLGSLPQHFADMFGWEEIVAAVAEAYGALPPQERAVAGIFAQNYGEAGAIDFLGPRYGLPHAVSGHNNYWLWGPGDYSGKVMIILGGDEADNQAVCESLQQVGTTHCGYCMPYENNLPVYVCRGLKLSPRELWPAVKNFI
jgi:4-amino-4-deoxy-L-arabinose transferase-like glycosyltransferase